MTKNILAPLGMTAAALAIDARNSEENTWFWNNTFDNFKWTDEGHFEIRSGFGSSLFKILMFYGKEPLKQLKMKQNKKENFYECY